jgi:hypothetical protein
VRILQTHATSACLCCTLVTRLPVVSR